MKRKENIKAFVNQQQERKGYVASKTDNFGLTRMKIEGLLEQGIHPELLLKHLLPKDIEKDHLYLTEDKFQEIQNGPGFEEILNLNVLEAMKALKRQNRKGSRVPETQYGGSSSQG